jgi:hypothetical protein
MILIGIVLATVAYHIVERVPAETLSIALGVACGIGASVPISVGLIIALLRQRQSPEAEVETREIETAPARVHYPPTPQYLAAPTAPSQPQIIVLSPQGQFAPGRFAQGMQFPVSWTNPQYPFMQEQSDAVDAREWRIIGEE